MTYIVICASALLVSGLTLFSGFGLGTLLMPAFALFFPVHVAVAATAVVQGSNNMFKILMVGRNADRDLVLRFGVSAIMAAFAGAAVLGYVSGFGELLRYSIGAKMAIITPIKLLMGILMFFFQKDRQSDRVGSVAVNYGGDRSGVCRCDDRETLDAQGNDGRDSVAYRLFAFVSFSGSWSRNHLIDRMRLSV